MKKWLKAHPIIVGFIAGLSLAIVANSTITTVISNLLSLIPIVVLACIVFLVLKRVR